MKLVTHLSYWDKAGGAAVAAWRLHEGMQRFGVESRMVSRRRISQGPDVSSISSDLFEAADVFFQRRVRPTQPPGATLFSFSPTTIPLMEHPWIAAADVVHLHQVSDFISPEDIEQLCASGKTVFWTFHSQWAYTGGCHYVGGVRRLPEDWQGTAQVAERLHPLVLMELERKKRIFSRSNIQVIAPCEWMAREAAASGVFAPENIHVVPYGIDLAVYSPATAGMPAAQAREEKSPVSLLFGCQNLTERRKGYQELREALVLCMSDPIFAEAAREGQICLRTFGWKPVGEMDLPIPVTHVGVLDEESEVVGIFRSSSAFVCPTLDDNLPNVVMESLACGCPVVAFATGGVPDMVKHDQNGLLAPQGDVPELARLLKDFCLNEVLRTRLREGAAATDLTRWSLEAQASHILGLYDSVRPDLKSNDTRRMPAAPAELNLDGRILPQFATEIAGALVEERRFLKSSAAATAAAQNQKIRQAEDRIARLKQESDAKTTKVAELLTELRAIRAKLKQANQMKKQLKVKLIGSKEKIRTLKQHIAKNRPLFQRIWRFLRRSRKS